MGFELQWFWSLNLIAIWNSLLGLFLDDLQELELGLKLELAQIWTLQPDQSDITQCDSLAKALSSNMQKFKVCQSKEKEKGCKICKGKRHEGYWQMHLLPQNLKSLKNKPPFENSFLPPKKKVFFLAKWVLKDFWRNLGQIHLLVQDSFVFSFSKLLYVIFAWKI